MSNQLRRRLGCAVAIVGVALLHVAVPVSAAAATVVTVGKADPSADNTIPVDVGYDVGIFKKHGLDLKIVDFGGGSKMAQAMAAGSVDLGVGAGAEMAFVAKGAPMLAVCESAGPISFLSVGVPWDSPIKSLSDLRGKTIGITSAGSLTDWLAHELSRDEGWGSNGVNTVAIGGGIAPVRAAFVAHQVDVAINGTSKVLALAEKKEGRVLAPVSAYAGKMASGALFASSEFIAADPGAVRAFVAAWIETIGYMRAHKSETVKLESAVTHFEPDLMSKEYDMTIGMFTKDCRFDSESLATLKRSFVELKLLPATLEMAKLYTESYLPK